MVYGFNRENATLSTWHQAVNKAAYHLAKEDPDLLYAHAQLKTNAEREARKTYIFKKKLGSRSVHVEPQNNLKRPKISSRERNEKISSLSIQIDLIKKQM